jgi:hypothetical protein
MSTRERLDCQVDSLVALQVVVPVEGLGALVTLERTIILLLLLRWMMPIHWSTQLMW